MNPERLRSDHQRLIALAAEAPSLISIDSATGSPPRQYVLTLRCPGLAAVGGGVPRFRLDHTVEILFGPRYPIEEPTVEFKTPILHPHVWPHNRVCLGDWTTTEFLDHLVIRLFRIIQYDPAHLNRNSVANGAAQAWLDTHRDQFPLGTVVPGEQRPTPTMTFRRTS